MTNTCYVSWAVPVPVVGGKSTRRLLRGRGHPGLLHAPAADPLSGRERQIAMLAANGMASKDIAERLFLSVRTVSNHLQHAYIKLGVSGRAALAEAVSCTP